MRLMITTPTAIVTDLDNVSSVAAEDASGSFGILDGHADFLSVLSPSVVSWRRQDGGEGHCAVRRGVFTVQGGDLVSLATREAVISDDLEKLENEVIARFQERAEEERTARLEAARLRMKAIRRIILYLRGSGSQRIGGLS
jgi:F-type H+-transporting ATPase subunit epsilon